MRFQPTSSALAEPRKALIVPKDSGIRPLSARPRTRLCICAGFAPATNGLSVRCSTVELASYRDVRVLWFHHLLDDAMPHASCASLAGSHRTSRLQAQHPARPFGSGLMLSRHLSFFHPALACGLEPDDYPCPSTVTVCVSAVLGATVSGGLRRCPRPCLCTPVSSIAHRVR
jgi:hypothetical protein